MSYPDLFRLAVTTAPNGVLVLDEGGRILFANPSAGEMFGFAAGELTNVPVDALVPGVLAPVPAAVGASRSEGPTDEVAGIRGRQQARGKDGVAFPVEVVASPASLDGQPVTVLSIIDGTILHGLEKAVHRNAAFERAVAEMAASFVNLPTGEVDAHITASLGRMAQMIGAERSSIWQVVGADFLYTHLWRRDPHVLPPAERYPADAKFPWVMGQLRQGKVVAFEHVEEVPSATDRATYSEVGIRSSLVVPLVVDGTLEGLLSFSALTTPRPWEPHTLERMPLVAAVFASAIARKRSRDALEHALVEVERLKEQLQVENVQLRREVKVLKGPRVLATESLASRQVVAQIEQVAPTPATVLMLGETGSGKEVFAEVLHEMSPRRHKPMIRVNCSAIPMALIESELFGRERGAYTGALSRQLGRFEIADGSTIFLDEVGELPLDMQVKLLRVLQDRVIERLGNPHPIKVNVRVIAATNRDLEQAVADKAFRADLYYRLNVFPIRIPPLRERVEDIPSLVWTFISEFSTAFGKNIQTLSKQSLQAVQTYPWPGNVRELRNVVERAVIVATGPNLVIDLPRATPAARRKSLKFVDVEVDHLRAVLESTGWRIRGRGGAADLLGIKPTTLESRMAKLGIVRGKGAEKAAEPRPGGPSTSARD